MATKRVGEEGIMNTQDHNSDKQVEGNGDAASSLPPVSGLNRQEIETLWGGSIRKGADATRTIKVVGKRSEGEGTASVSSRLNLRRQMVSERDTASHSKNVCNAERRMLVTANVIRVGNARKTRRTGTVVASGTGMWI